MKRKLTVLMTKQRCHEWFMGSLFQWGSISLQTNKTKILTHLHPVLNTQKMQNVCEELNLNSQYLKQHDNDFCLICSIISQVMKQG